jgi:hypothetical protein
VARLRPVAIKGDIARFQIAPTNRVYGADRHQVFGEAAVGEECISASALLGDRNAHIVGFIE